MFPNHHLTWRFDPLDAGSCCKPHQRILARDTSSSDPVHVLPSVKGANLSWRVPGSQLAITLYPYIDNQKYIRNQKTCWLWLNDAMPKCCKKLRRVASRHNHCMIGFMSGGWQSGPKQLILTVHFLMLSCCPVRCPQGLQNFSHQQTATHQFGLLTILHAIRANSSHITSCSPSSPIHKLTHQSGERKTLKK